MNPIEELLQWIRKQLGLNPVSPNRPEVVALRHAVSEGKRLKRAEEYAKAVEQFEQAVSLARKINDTSAAAIVNLQLADVLIAQKNTERAAVLLRMLQDEAVSRNQMIQLAYTLIALGTLAQSKNEWDAARSHFEEALDTSRKQFAPGAEGRAMGHLADVYLHEGNASYAAHLLEEALPKLEASGDIELSSYFVGLLGRARIANGSEQDGQNLVGRALRLADTMRYVTYQRMWHIVLGDRAMHESRYTDANNHYEQALRLMPENEPSGHTQEQLLRVLRQLMRACIQLNKREDALIYARRAMKLAPDDVETRGVMGVVLRGLGRNEEALPHLEAAQTNEETDILRNLAGAYAETGAKDRALAMFQRALNIASQREDSLEIARTQRDIGAFYARMGDAQNAIKAWETAVELYDQHDFHAQVARLYCDIANLRGQLGQGVRVMKDYEQALMRLGHVNDDETRGIVLSNAATAYVEQGDLETAESFLAESIQIAQKMRDYKAEATRQGNMGWFLLSTGRFKRAIAALEYAIKQSEKMVMPLHVAVQTGNLGLAYGALGEHEKAMHLHRRALTLIESVSVPYWKAVHSLNLAGELLQNDRAPENAPEGAPSGVPESDEELKEGRDLIETALQIGVEIDNGEIKIRALTAKARATLLAGDVSGAEATIQEAIELARRTHRRRLLGEALVVESEVHGMLGQHEKAVETWEEAHKILTLLHHPAANKTPEWV